MDDLKLPLLFSVIGYLVKMFIDSMRKGDDNHDKSIKENTEAIWMLKTQIAVLTETLKPLFEIKAEVDDLQQKVGKIENIMRIKQDLCTAGASKLS
jgi:uncharacterized protein YoxC